MLKISDSSRAYLTEMRALATDSAGNEHLVGLTIEESQFYLAYGEARLRDQYTTREDGDRYLELHDKHEKARIQILAAESQLRNGSPTRH